MARWPRRVWQLCLFIIVAVAWLLVGSCEASVGDRLPEFQRCIEACKDVNCKSGDSILPLQLRLLLWTCSSECDYTCQHVITAQRLRQHPRPSNAVVQFHGKWPFQRFLGLQEPFSVLFSLFNLLAHRQGIARIKREIPAYYPLRKYYLLFGYLGITSWVFSMLFHTRDFNITEKADYFAAGASVLYGLYYTPIRVFRLAQDDDSGESDQYSASTMPATAQIRNPLPLPTNRTKNKKTTKRTVLHLWTVLCALLYIAHVSYLTLWRWSYTYNMAANVVVGVIQNLMWSVFSIRRYQRLKKPWAAWPGLIVAWIVLAMSLELLDFPPWGGWIDAHSLWHLGTVAPTVLWYRFLVKDAQEEIQGARLKA